jgi:pantoate--beta-alanine ligase
VKVFHTGAEWKEIRLQLLQAPKTIGLVPTMGALHQGHLDLVDQCIKNADVAVVSIFVNPTQFNNKEDFDKYPNTLDADLELLEKAGVDYVFVPSVETMYPVPTKLQFDFGDLERILEGAFRPGHFNGVGIIVSKLFHSISPDIVFFGQKDLQQVAIIRSLVNDLSFPLELRLVPTRREEDGLAMSSRNRRLNPEQRKKALILHDSLVFAKKELEKGQNWLDVKQIITRNFEELEGAELEYFELVETDKFEIFKEFDPKKKSSICVAAYIGDVRLIDNLSINS